jgi:hypothetical protein
MTMPGRAAVLAGPPSRGRRGLRVRALVYRRGSGLAAHPEQPDVPEEHAERALWAEGYAVPLLTAGLPGGGACARVYAARPGAAGCEFAALVDFAGEAQLVYFPTWEDLLAFLAEVLPLVRVAAQRTDEPPAGPRMAGGSGPAPAP